MKKYVLLLLVFSKMVTAQYGADGGVVMINIAITNELERAHLVQMDEDQEATDLNSSVIAIETAAITVIERILNKSLTTISPVIENAQVIAEIVVLTRNIVDYQDLSLQLATGMPELMAIYTPNIANIIIDTSFAMNDLIIATSNSEYNLMMNADRLKLMYMVQDELRVVLRESKRLHTALRSVGTSLTVGEVLENVPFIDVEYQEILEQTFDHYEVIFNGN